MFTNAISILIVLIIILSSIFSGNFKAYSWKSYEEWGYFQPIIEDEHKLYGVTGFIKLATSIENTWYHYQLVGHFKKLS